MNHTQELKISVPDGKKAIYDEATQTIKFVDVEPIRSKSFLEFRQNHPCIHGEYYINCAGKIEKYDTNSRRNYTHINCLETEEDAKGILALIQLKRLHDEWVGDWRPNYNDSTKKWQVSFFCDNIDIAWTDGRKRFLVFPTQEMAYEFSKCFDDLIEQAKMFL